MSLVVRPDGRTYPVVDVEISSASHPFYTGKQKLVDSGGRVDRFKKRLEKKADEPKPAKAPKARPPKPELKPEPTPEPVAVAAEAAPEPLEVR